MTDSSQLLSDLKSTTQAVRNQDWLSAGLGGASTAVDVLKSTHSPLSAVGNAGFGWILGFVQFLEEPLDQLRGNPDAVPSSAQGYEGAAQHVSSVADSYQDSSQSGTSSWSGSAASGYQNTSSQLSDGISALSQASSAIAGATAGGGSAVAETFQAVSQLISEAAGQIVTVLAQAVAAAPTTGGASIAAAVPRVVQIAVNYGQQISAKMATLLSSSQALLQLIETVVQGVSAVTKVLTQISERATA